MLNNTSKILIAYTLGQSTQLVIHGMALNFNMWNDRQIPFCIAAGFVILFAVISGVFISEDRSEKKAAHEKKSYSEYLKPKEEKEVIPQIYKKEAKN